MKNVEKFFCGNFSLRLKFFSRKHSQIKNILKYHQRKSANHICVNLREFLFAIKIYFTQIFADKEYIEIPSA